jgi:small-conductance mechanosensitive channel
MNAAELLKTDIISTGKFSISVGEIVNAILIFIVASFLVKIIAFIITRNFRGKSRSDGRHFSIIQLVKYFIWILATVFILQSLGLNVTFLIASSAAIMVGIGLGLQSIFKDFISGVVLLMEGTIKVDDIVELDGLVVQVNSISLRTSRVTTREDNVVIIPNHNFVENKIVNWTNNMLPSRFIIEVGVDYSSDIHLVEKVLIECAIAHKDVLNEKDFYPSVRFKNFGSYSLDFQIFFYSYNLFRIENVKSALRYQILREFRENKIIIPFPQHVIHTVRPTDI